MERDSRKIIQRLNAEGWIEVSVKGSHHKFRKDGTTIIVPHPKKDLPPGYGARHRKAGRMVTDRSNR